MDTEQQEYVSLDSLAGTLRLPKRYLRELAVAGDIPMLPAGRRMRFCVDDVRAALRILAASRAVLAEQAGRKEGNLCAEHP
ncbi:MAG: hypothetical protein JW959_10810 [Pirellulales bacterium]|nr:hypothetical protein [Pirellulales bacterium]